VARVLRWVQKASRPLKDLKEPVAAPAGLGQRDDPPDPPDGQQEVDRYR
jgi:hypothetical protein